MGRVWYATRGRVMRAADVNASAYLSDEIDAAIESASEAVDRLTRRGDETRPGFAPWVGTIEFNWPVDNNDEAYKFWLNQNALLSPESATSGGVDISADLIPWPEYGPPYTRLDVYQASGSVLSFLDGSGQRSLSITGEWGMTNAEKQRTAWALAGTIDAGVTTAVLNAPADVGSLVRIGNERMIVTDKTWADSGQTGSIVASQTAQSLAVSDGTAFRAGEELILDAERVLVREIVGNMLNVRRAVSGSTLAAHTGSPIYWARTCEVERGALGTTAAAHTAGDAIAIHDVPGLIEQLTVAYALDQRQQEMSAYVRTVGQGEGQRNASGAGIRELEERVQSAYGRRLRLRVI
jgi:hypothetical protein